MLKETDLVKRMAEDLEYLLTTFDLIQRVVGRADGTPRSLRHRRHAMTNPNRNKGKKQDGDTTPQDDTAPAE